MNPMLFEAAARMEIDLCFRDQALDWRKDIKVLDARHWSTKLTPEQLLILRGGATGPLRPNAQLCRKCSASFSRILRDLCAPELREKR